jgi:beta-glucosidase
VDFGSGVLLKSIHQGRDIFMAIHSSSLTRRELLLAAVGCAAAVSTSRSAPRHFEQMPPASFPKDFGWGAVSAAYQVEGAWKEGGKGESIWDRFSHTPGRIKNGDTGDIACDYYHRYKEDIQSLRALGLNSYRFSISWPRIQPHGSGKANEKGMDFYKRVVDTLLEAKICPIGTLYNWDLPQALEDAGGWPERATAQRFADYVEVITRELGDRLRHYIIFNEPWVFTALGYLLGTHAPGRTDLDSFLFALHTVSLAQGMAFRVIKALQSKAVVGSAFGMSAMHPMTDSAADRRAAERAHLSFNTWFLEAAMKGRYPDALIGAAPENLGIRSGDMEKTRAPFDFLWLNTYTRSKVSANAAAVPDLPSGQPSQTDEDLLGLYEIVMRITKDYDRPVIELSQTGRDYGERPDVQGIVKDSRRIGFYRSCLAELAQAIRDGANVRGFHFSNLMDGFEWADGYTKRFGLIYVDYSTQRRTVKKSGRWFASVAKANSLMTNDE